MAAEHAHPHRLDATVLICETLDAIAKPDALAWEVVVVDNNLTDRTQAVVEWQQRYPARLRCRAASAV